MYAKVVGESVAVIIVMSIIFCYPIFENTTSIEVVSPFFPCEVEYYASLTVRGKMQLVCFTGIYMNELWPPPNGTLGLNSAKAISHGQWVNLML